MPDFTIQDEGTLVMFYPQTEAAREWWAENCGEGMSWAGGHVVEYRYAADILEGITAEGLVYVS